MMSDDSVRLERDERVVAFLDVLGTRGLLKRIEGSPAEGNDLLALLEEVEAAETWVGTERARVELGFSVTAFSDSIVLSMKKAATAGAAEWTIVDRAGWLATRFLQRGILSRGAVTTGWLHHRGRVAVGRGLVDAYEWESRVARVPRILLADPVVDAMRSFSARVLPQSSSVAGVAEPNAVQWSLERLIDRDSDGFWIVNPLYPPWFDDDGARLAGIVKVRDGLSRQLVAAQSKATSESGDMDILSKVRWLANRFNLKVPEEMRELIQPIVI